MTFLPGAVGLGTDIPGETVPWGLWDRPRALGGSRGRVMGSIFTGEAVLVLQAIGDEALVLARGAVGWASRGSFRAVLP